MTTSQYPSPSASGPAPQDKIPNNATEGAALLARLERIPLTRFHLRIASILGVGTFFDAFDGLIIAVAMTSVLKSLGASVNIAGLLIATGYVGQIIGAIAFGFVSERYGRKTAFVTASVAFGLLSLAAALAWNVESLMTIRLLQGIGLGAEVPVAAAMFNEFVRAKARGTIALVYESLFGWGLLAASLIGGLFLVAFPPADAWRYLFAIGAIPMLTAIWAYFRLPESPRHLLHKGDLDGARATITEMEASTRLGNGQVTDHGPRVPITAVTEPHTRFGELFGPKYLSRTAMLWCTWFTTFFALWGLSTLLPTLLVSQGVSESTAALMSGAITVADMVFIYIAAGTLDRLGRRFWFIAGYGLALTGGVFGVVCIGPLGLTGWPILLIASATVLIGVNINGPLIYMYSAELYPTRMRAWATMLGSTLRGLAAVIAPIVLSLLTTGADGISQMFGLFVVVLAVGLFVFARYGIETKQRALEELAQ